MLRSSFLGPRSALLIICSGARFSSVIAEFSLLIAEVTAENAARAPIAEIAPFGNGVKERLGPAVAQEDKARNSESFKRRPLTAPITKFMFACRRRPQ